MSDQKDFFKRKEEKKVDIPEAGDYEPTNFENDLQACGIIDVKNLQERYTDLFSTGFVVDSDRENPVVTVCKRIEDRFSKREIAFLMAKDLLQESYNQAIEQDTLIKSKA